MFYNPYVFKRVVVLPTKTFNSLQTITQTGLNINTATNADGRTNTITNGTLINTWGIAVTYTHARVNGQIYYVTSFSSAYNIYGYFVDAYGTKITTPFSTLTAVTAGTFELGTYT